MIAVLRRLRATLLALLDGPITNRWPDQVYAVRPYDQVADARRWRWQPGARCGSHAVAALPVEVRRALEAGAAAWVRRGRDDDPDARYGITDEGRAALAAGRHGDDVPPCDGCSSPLCPDCRGGP